MREVDQQSIGFKYGFEVKLLREISKILNFTMEFIETSEGYGKCNQTTDNCTGIMGLIRTGRADIGAGSFLVTIQRVKIVDLSEILVTSTSGFFVRVRRTPEKKGYLYSRVSFLPIESQI